MWTRCCVWWVNKWCSVSVYKNTRVGPAVSSPKKFCLKKRIFSGIFFSLFLAIFGWNWENNLHTNKWLKKKSSKTAIKSNILGIFLPFIAIFGWNWGKKLSYEVKKKVLKKNSKKSSILSIFIIHSIWSWLKQALVFNLLTKKTPPFCHFWIFENF